MAAEGKKNLQKLQELMSVSHSHVQRYLHKLKDITGTLIFPQDPKQLNQNLKTIERRIRRFATEKQLKLLFPDGSNKTDSNTFDFTLFKMLIKHFGQTGKVKKFWEEKPLQTDTTDEANICRLLFGRNSIQHCPPDVKDKEFKEIATDLITALISLGEDKQKLQNILPPVQYGLSKPVDNFFGRAEDLNQIHKMVKDGMDGIVRVVVHGMAGLGKSETVRKYCHELGEYFDNNILWINAANETSLEASFREIADMVGLAIRDENGNLKEVNSIINSLHKHFQSNQILYIFDDVSKVQCLTPFLPKYKPSTSIITTQLKDWPYNNFQMHELQKFDEYEGKLFLQNNLKDKKMDEAQLKLVLKQLGGHPLALQQFIIFTKNTMLSVEEYLKLLEKETAKLLRSNMQTMYGGKSVIGAIRITVEKLAQTEDSALALGILNTISYFYCDEISFEALKLTFPDDIMEIDNAVQKLQSYSLVQKVETHFIRVHSLVQKSMTYQHEKDNNKYFQKCVAMFQNQLEVENGEYNHESFGKEWYKHLIYFISTNIKNTEIHRLLLERFKRILSMMRTKGRLNDLIEFYEFLLTTLAEKRGPSHEKSVRAMSILAECYYEIDQYDYAVELFQKVVEEDIKRYGKNHILTLETMNNLALCFKCNERTDEATKMYQDVLAGKIKLIGKKDPSTLKTICNLAVCFKDEGRLDEAIQSFEEILDEFIKLYGKTDPSTLLIMNNLTSCLQEKGRLERAIEMFQEVLNGKIQRHGKRHPSTLITMSNLATCFMEKGSLEEAIDLFEEVIDLEMELYGKKNQGIIDSMHNLALCFQDKGRLNEAIKIIEEVLDEQIKLHGKSHPSTIIAMGNLASCYADNGSLKKPKELFEEAIKISKLSLGENHSLTKSLQENFSSYFKR